MATMKEQQEQEFRSELDDKLHVATCHIPRGIGRGEKVRHAAQALGFMYDLGRKHAHAEGKAALESEARLHAQHYARADKAEKEVARLSKELSRFLLGTDRLEILRERDDARTLAKNEHGRVLIATARADDAEKQLAEVREDCLDARGRLEEAIQERRREVARTRTAEAKADEAEAREATLAAANKALADDVTRCAGIEQERAKLILWLRLSRRWLHFLTREVGNKHPVPLIKRIDTLIPREPDSVRWSHK